MMIHANRILVVTDDRGAAAFWTATLELAGYDTDTCPGPGATTDCPRLRGSRCSLRERVDVAVVDLDCAGDPLVCTRVIDDGSTVFFRRAGAAPVGMGELSSAVTQALHHVDRLNAEPLLDHAVMAPDLD